MLKVMLDARTGGVGLLLACWMTLWPPLAASAAAQSPPPPSTPAPAPVPDAAPPSTPAPAPVPDAAPLPAPAPAPVPDAAPPPAPGQDAARVSDPSTGTILEVAAKPVLRLKGKSTWDDGFDTLRKALDRLETEAARLNLAREGNILAYFVDSDDNGFSFEAMVPLREAPPVTAVFDKDIEAAQSPAGRAVIFHHEGAYDDIDTAYEAFTAWLDDKNLVSSGKFLEEYVVWPGKSDETAMKIRISVFLK